MNASEARALSAEAAKIYGDCPYPHRVGVYVESAMREVKQSAMLGQSSCTFTAYNLGNVKVDSLAYSPEDVANSVALVLRNMGYKASYEFKWCAVDAVFALDWSE